MPSSTYYRNCASSISTRPRASDARGATHRARSIARRAMGRAGAFWGFRAAKAIARGWTSRDRVRTRVGARER